MKATISSRLSGGLRLQSDLRVGITITNLDSFSHALIEEISINDPGIIPDNLVEKCAKGFMPAMQCVSVIKSLGAAPAAILSTAMDVVVEQCKQTGLGIVCDAWGDAFGVPFAHG